MRRVALALAGLGLVTAAAVPAAAIAAKPKPDSFRTAAKSAGKLPTTNSQAATTACGLGIGAVNATGTAGGYDVTASRPLTVNPLDPYKLFAVRSSASWYLESDGTTDFVHGLVLQGDNLYGAIAMYQGSATTPTVRAIKLGTGWRGFSQITDSNYSYGERSFLYGLHANGSLYRYSVQDRARAYGSAPGFGSVKAITLIAETATYDTLLVLTKGGALYTVHVPVTLPMKPVVKQVRASGFAAFDSLVAQRCGATSTLLTAFDHDTDTATVYAVSKATGTTTVIKSYGSFKATFGAKVHFLLTGSGGPQRVGE
ncbi:hypothetical protein JOF29_002058 [Kribbella aluminosa]|uniref:Uncharacterized protein n=1 Tax=Kribbella aluminosa TaxID=416017 RepID=A0ABS4UH49_9ACTN|nr:hypothetical protein [Kribbella aluminosa]MBP2350975.1 hypothetical protein [Kribbella aluminosa]